MAANLYWLNITLLFLCLIWASLMFYKYPSWALAMLLPLLAWFIFDPLVLALGNLLGEGSTLQALSYLRYLLRALAIPLLLIVAFDQAKRAQVRWTNDPLLMLLLGLVIVGLIVLGLFKEFIGVSLAITEIEGIKQYKEEESLGMPLAALATMGLIALLGVGVLVKMRSPWLLLGGLLATAGVLIPTSILPHSRLAFVSVGLVFCFLLTEIRLHKIVPNPLIR